MPIEYFKNKARDALGVRCFLQRDRYERALFFSDFPKFKNKDLESRLKDAGFSVKTDKGFALISPDEKLLKEFFLTIGPQPLPRPSDSNMQIISCANILRMHENKADKENAEALVKLMHILNRKDFSLACSFLMRRLAVSLRERKSVPKHGAELLLFSFNKTEVEK